MSDFAETAARLFATAQGMSDQGEAPTAYTFVVGDSGVRLIAHSDWSLPQLEHHHGASSVYRITQTSDRLKLEGLSGSRTCQFESAPPPRMRPMLPPAYEVVAANAAPVPASRWLSAR